MTIHHTHPFADPPSARDAVRAFRGRWPPGSPCGRRWGSAGLAGLTVSSLMVANGVPPAHPRALDPLSDLCEAAAGTAGCSGHGAPPRPATARRDLCWHRLRRRAGRSVRQRSMTRRGDRSRRCDDLGRRAGGGLAPGRLVAACHLRPRGAVADEGHRGSPGAPQGLATPSWAEPAPNLDPEVLGWAVRPARDTVTRAGEGRLMPCGWRRLCEPEPSRAAVSTQQAMLIRPGIRPAMNESPRRRCRRTGRQRGEALDRSAASTTTLEPPW